MNTLGLLELFITLSLVSMVLHVLFYMFFEGSPYKILNRTSTTWNKAFMFLTMTTSSVTGIFWLYLVFLEKNNLSGEISILCIAIWCVFVGVLVAKLKSFKKE